MKGVTPAASELLPSSTRSSPWFLGLLFILVLGVQLVLYRDSLDVKPSSDDFIALHQIDRGENEGIWSFFMASDVSDYRPLQNVTFWLFGTVSRWHTLRMLRLLHFLSFTFYASVAFLWIHTLGLSRMGAVVAVCVVFLHPTQTGALAGLDNYSRFVVSAWVWLGAWSAYVWSGRSRLAVPLVSLCFAIALGYMEYGIALIPLAVLATAWKGEGRWFHDAWVMTVALLVIFGVYFLIRVSGQVATTSGTDSLSLDPLVWVKNTGMMAAAALFFGNTVPIMQEGSLPGFAWMSLNVMLIAGSLGYGIWSARRSLMAYAGGDPTIGSPAVAEEQRHLSFLAAAFAVSFFPMLLMKHISEIYLSAMILALALLAGFATRGWVTASRPLRYLALVLAGAQMCMAVNAIQGKIAGINEAGERTDAMMRQLLESLPQDVDAKRVATVFLRQKGAGNGSYSVFAIPDEEWIPEGNGTYAIRWFRPDKDIRLDHLVVSDPSVVDLQPYDLVLLWENSSRRFSLMKRSAS